MMERWNGVFKVPLCNNGAYYQVAASLRLTPSKTIQVPSANAIFFSGDRVGGTGNPVIEKLSNLQRIAEILVSKFSSSINAWAIESSTFNLGFAVYKDFIPTVNHYGEPSSYNPSGFPASSSIVQLLSKCLFEAKKELGEHQTDSTQVSVTDVNSTCPTILLGFSKGGIVLNQLLTELAALPIDSNPETLNNMDTEVIPSSKENFLNSIAEIHYIDVGLNSPGAYLTDRDTLQKLSNRAKHGASSSIQFLIHGTPRQWKDKRRPWIQKEKDELVRLLEVESQTSHGKLAVCERLYFGDSSPDLQMHFEIIDALDVSSGLRRY